MTLATSAPFEHWLRPGPSGLYCVPGGFHIDPHGPVDRAVITHGHSDHARPGHAAVLATAETLAIMKVRLGDGAGGWTPALEGLRRDMGYGGSRVGDVNGDGSADIAFSPSLKFAAIRRGREVDVVLANEIRLKPDEVRGRISKRWTEMTQPGLR